ncbi:helix-turn-helix transcriptional regulator [Streptomyces sp. NBC_00140]|uniref:helix-turn-helix domain-containing protein n=1 Tax=Streptomyces sp. NBC_00140 TaxID=2975664 RepID=UPI002252397D|nr:helix-turn-helix transcriptional regulator [Streptomyces sp. NBC_00140]MCX5332098.1 helix-turn-helix domain-containing protein [Streptomyces sp. NBC_00140]
MVASSRTCARCGARLSRANSGAVCGPCERTLRQTLSASAVQAAEPAPWLYEAGQQQAPPDGSHLKEALRAYRAVHKLTQHDLAALLGYGQSYVSLLERGKRSIRDVDELRRIAGVLGLPEDELGLLPAALSIHSEFAPPLSGASATPQNAVEDQRRWRLTRRELNRHRSELTAAAAALYPDFERAGNSPVLTRPGWMAPAPIELAAVEMSWINQVPPPTVVGSEPESEAVRPMSARGNRYERYSQAIRAVDKPSLFENRPSFRLMGTEWAGDSARMAYGYTTYFDMVDVCEGVAHELADAWLAAGSDPAWLQAPRWEDLPFRSLVGDPFDLARRPLLPSIDTLTIRRDRDSASFVLHHRSAANVALAGGTYHIMPAGVFQPSSVMPWDQSNDFDLWRNMLREFAEEFLGVPEADGSSGEPIDYDGTEPFKSLNDARRAGKLQAHTFGIGLDPLTLAGEILSVVVIDADVYDRVFHTMVSQNTEGSVVSSSATDGAAGIPFTEANVRRLLDSEPLASAAAACLDLSWQHRKLLLGG